METKETDSRKERFSDPRLDDTSPELDQPDGELPERDTITAFLIAGYLTSRDLLDKMRTSRAEMCGYLIENVSIEERLNLVRTAMLRRRMLKPTPDDLRDKYNSEMTKMLQLDLTVAQQGCVHNAHLIEDFVKLFDDIASVLRSSDTPQVQIIKLTNLLI